MTENPWKTKSKETVYENPWIRVEHHEVITPAGKDGIYGKTHFKNKAPKGEIVLVIKGATDEETEQD